MRYPFFALAFVAQTLLAAILAFVPLFDLLGYEFSLACTGLAVVTGQIVGLGLRLEQDASWWRRAGLVLGWSAAHLLGALVLICLNMVRVRNCDILTGLGFFLLLPLPTAFLAGALGHYWRLIFDRWSRRVAAVMVLPLAVVSYHFWRLYSEPPIFVYDHLFGYFAGSIYDEGLRPSTTLAIFRGVTLLWVGVVLGACHRLSRRRASRTVGVLALSLTIVVDLLVGAAVPYRSGQGVIEAELAVHIRRPGLLLFLPAGTNTQMQQAVADDHVFRLAQLSHRLGLRPEAYVDRPIRSYVYRDAAHKAKFMGGRATMIAKPWLRQIHIHGVRAEHRVMPHELIHVLAADFASPPLYVTTGLALVDGLGPLSALQRRLLVNMGLVEGLAEAYSPDYGPLDLHTSARAMRDLKMAPQIERLLLAHEFWQVAPRRAYTMVGSFVRFLGDTYGVAKVGKAYDKGDFEAAFGRPLPALVAEWTAYVDRLPILPRDKREAEERFAEQSIFKRPCAHVIAGLRQAAARATGTAALKLHQEICAQLGDSTTARVALALAYARADDADSFMNRSQTLLAGGRLRAKQRTRLLEKRAEIHWRRGALHQAMAGFETVLRAQQSLASERLQWVRLWALRGGIVPVDAPITAPSSASTSGPADGEHPVDASDGSSLAPNVSGAAATSIASMVRTRVHRLFGASKPAKATLLLLEDLRHRMPEDKTLPYLLARQLLNAGGDDPMAARYLLLAAGHPFAPIEAERLRLLARLRRRQGDLDEASALWRRYTAVVPSSGERSRGRDALARLHFAQTGTIEAVPPLSAPPRQGGEEPGGPSLLPR